MEDEVVEWVVYWFQVVVLVLVGDVVFVVDDFVEVYWWEYVVCVGLQVF